MTLQSSVSRWRRLVAELRTFSILSPSERMRAVRKRGGDRLSSLWSRLARRTMTGQIRAVQILLGARAANAYFWRSPTSRKIWFNAETRLYSLLRDAPGAVGHFVGLAFRNSGDATVLLGLARNPGSREHLARLLASNPPATTPFLLGRLRNSRDYTAIYTGVCALLLDREMAERFVEDISGLHKSLVDRSFHILDSMGTRPARPPENPQFRSLRESGLGKPARHRLVVAEALGDLRAIAQLFADAEEVTVLILNDTYGRAKFDEYIELLGPVRVTVEHIRTRISRFSQAYISIHEAIKDAARLITGRLFGPGGVAAELEVEDRFLIEVTLADHLFFQLLKAEALRTLLDIPDFDHIVIACQNQAPGSEFFLLLSSLENVRSDPRIELVSVSRSLSACAQFGNCLRTVMSDFAPPGTLPGWRPPIARLRENLQQNADRLAATLPGFDIEEKQHRVLLATTNNDAYNSSTLNYLASLTRDHATRVAFCGANATPLLEGQGGVAADIVQPIPTALAAGFPALVNWMRSWLVDLADEVADPAVARILRLRASRAAAEAIVDPLVFGKVLDAWFGRLASEGGLPDLVALTPARVPSVAAFAPLARKYGIPSLALEPHGLNANYARYTNILTDRYGVISEYFRAQSDGFGIPVARTTVIGSPRIIRPQGYDIDTARAAARQRMASENGADFGRFRANLSYFCQPSDWTHVAKVWHNILTATEGLDTRIFVKTHPEEAPARVAAYLDVACACDAADRVEIVDTDPTTAIEIADIVLTGYSAAAIDAAILGCPVVCVTDGKVDYPVAQHEIIDAPFVRSAADLRHEVLAFLDDPAAYNARATAFLAHNPQFLEGPDSRLTSLVEEILEGDRDVVIRRPEDLPTSAFLSGPHPVFPV